MGRLISGGVMIPAPKARKPVPGGRLISGGRVVGLHQQRRPHQHPGKLISGGAMIPAKGAKKAGHAKKAKRGLARSATEVACCAAEALAASLRLAGGTVADEDVLALYRHTADGPDTGATISATLKASGKLGLGGIRPVGFAPALECLFEECGDAGDNGVPDQVVIDLELAAVGAPHGLILGVDLPGPHTVYDDGEAWWSWGEPFDPASFPGAVIEEAWAVTW